MKRDRSYTIDDPQVRQRIRVMWRRKEKIKTIAEATGLGHWLVKMWIDINLVNIGKDKAWTPKAAWPKGIKFEDDPKAARPEQPMSKFVRPISHSDSGFATVSNLIGGGGIIGRRSETGGAINTKLKPHSK